jgi:tellurite resistance protein TerC
LPSASTLLKYGLAIVLMFIGVKMLLIDVYKIPVGFSLAVVAVIIGASVWASLRKEARENKAS